MKKLHFYWLKIVKPSAWLIAAMIAASVVLRLTLRDQVRLLAAFYYATPLGACVAGCAVAALLFRISARQRMVWMALGAMIALMPWWFETSWHFAPANPANPAATAGRVVFWNIAHGTMGHARDAKRILEEKPDLIAITEVGRSEPYETQFVSTLGDYHTAPVSDELALFSRSEVEIVKESINARGMHWCAYRTRLAGREIVVMIVDPYSNPTRSRQQVFDAVRSVAAQWADEPLLVMGDFNTPRDASCFDDWRGDWTNGFEAAGRGYGASWPMPLPVLSLDQAWCNRLLRFERFELRRSLLSDHRMLSFDVSFAGR